MVVSVSGCGGGGGAAPPAATVPAYVQERIIVAEQAGCSEVDGRCVRNVATFMDESGDASFFWTRPDLSTNLVTGLFAALNRPGSRSVGTAAEIWPDLYRFYVSPKALGGNRFAAVFTHNINFGVSSAVVDLSSPSAPTVSSRVDVPVTASAQWISGLDGVFAFDASAPAERFSLGGEAEARVVHTEVPMGYFQHWTSWSVLAPASGVSPAAWRVVLAASPGTSEPKLQLLRVSLPSGEVVHAQEVSRQPRNTDGGWNCWWGGEIVRLHEWRVGNAALASVENNDNNSGCDIRVDGQVLNSPGVSLGWLDFGLGGDATGPVAVWSENRTDKWGSVLVWRRRVDGQWSNAAPISTDVQAYLIATKATGNAFAIAWKGCSASNDSSCASYVSKFVKGAWQTPQFADLGESVSSPGLAINSRGQAIVAWATERPVPCADGSSASCGRVLAYRF